MSIQRGIATLRAEMNELRAIAGADSQAYASDPAALMRAAGHEPDPWQESVLTTPAKRTLLLVTRQGGKSTVIASKALHKALYKPGALVLLLSPSQRQSGELFNKVVHCYRMADETIPVQNLSALRMELANGSRIVALPGTEKTIRGFSGVDLLIIDEASRVADQLYYSVRPMLAVSGGELAALTTPWGKRGWFHDEWTGGGEDWHRVKITAEECPRIPKDFLDEERRRLPAMFFRSEYYCEFTDTVDQVFRTEDIDRAACTDVPILFWDDEPGFPETPTITRSDVPIL